MRPNGSPKTVAASSKDTPCLARFAAAFRRSHSNSNTHFSSAFSFASERSPPMHFPLEVSLDLGVFLAGLDLLHLQRKAQPDGKIAFRNRQVTRLGVAGVEVL